MMHLPLVQSQLREVFMTIAEEAGMPSPVVFDFTYPKLVKFSEFLGFKDENDNNLQAYGWILEGEGPVMTNQYGSIHLYHASSPGLGMDVCVVEYESGAVSLIGWTEEAVKTGKRSSKILRKNVVCFTYTAEEWQAEYSTEQAEFAALKSAKEAEAQRIATQRAVESAMDSFGYYLSHD
jgi:hypothetical protein